MSRPSSAHSSRLFWIIAICIGLSSTVVFLNTIRLFLRRTSRVTSSVVAAALRSPVGIDCRNGPKGWGVDTPEATMFAYDVRTLRSMNKHAPKISPGLARSIKVRMPPLNQGSPVFGANGAMLLRVDRQGPCSLIVVRWKHANQERSWLLGTLAAVSLLLTLLTAALLFLTFLRPLLRRIQGVSKMAREVGREDAILAEGEILQDDLGTIEVSLRQAHERILEDRRRLAERNLALHRHLADVSHDLRTPIASLQLVLEQLSQQPEEGHLLLATAMGDTLYLEQLTNNLSVETRVRQGLLVGDEVTDASTELAAIVSRVAARFRVLTREKQMSLEYACPDQSVLIRGPSYLWERALSNLVHNAVRYGRAEGHVAIVLECIEATEEQPAHFVCQVMDDGPGVPPSVLPRLQERLFRAGDARQRDDMGQGLGLAITHEICLAFDVTLHFAPIEPCGLCVTLSGELLS